MSNLWRRGLVGSTHLSGRCFSDHFRTFTPRPDLFPGHLDPFVVDRDAFPLPGLRQSFRSPSCAVKPGTACVPKRPRHPGRGTRPRRAPPLAQSRVFPVPAPVRTQPATRSAGTRGMRGGAIPFRPWPSCCPDFFFPYSFVHGETLPNAEFTGECNKSSETTC